MSDASSNESALAAKLDGGTHNGPAAVPYFVDPALKQRLDLLQHLTEYADLLLVVKGSHGVGKTALLKQLLDRARDHWMACLIDANPLTTRDQMLSEFGRQLGLDLRGIAFDELQSVIDERLAALQRAGRVVLLIVDDAHALAVPVLDLIMHLFGLRGEGGKLVRVLLFAEPSLDETLQSPALRALKQQVTHTLDVPPFSLEQTEAFLAHYCTALGQVDMLPMDADTVERLYAESGGNPALLLGLAGAVSQPAIASSTHKVTESTGWIGALRRPRALIVGGVVGVLLLVLLFQGTINDFVATDDTPMVRADGPGSLPLPLPQPARPATGPAPARVPPDAQPLPKVETIPNPPPVVLAPPEEIPTAPQPPPAEAALPQPEVPVAADIGAAEQAPVVTEQTAGTTPVAPVAESAPSDSSRPAMLGRSWLLSRAPNHYTLQLMGVRDEAALLEFVQEHHLEGKVAYLRTVYQGGPWHVLLYGDFADRDAAVAARGPLVTQLRNVVPWPRPFSGIQELLHRQ